MAPEEIRAGRVHEIDDVDLEGFTLIAARFGQGRFAYVVTPNADHMLRFRDDPTFRAHYRAAGFILMDSRFVALLVQLLKGVKLRVCTGSDLTAALLSRVVDPDDRVIIIGCTPEQAHEISTLYGLRNAQHMNPPMGFINDSKAVEACLEFIERHSPFRFCFLAVGCPQQEAIAHLLHERGRARGLALCIGASLNFITGAETRAPPWMQRMALEWLFRLLQNPRRLAYRYLVRGPAIFGHLLRARIIPRTPRDLP